MNKEASNSSVLSRFYLLVIGLILFAFVLIGKLIYIQFYIGEEGDDERLEREVLNAEAVFINGLEVDQLHVDEPQDYGEYFMDEKTGAQLDTKAVKMARAEEIQFMKTEIDLYVDVSEEECWEHTGKAPVSTKWVDVNKGTAQDPDIRCRLVARDFRPRGEQHRENLFAAMPPLEAKKLLFRMGAAQPRVHREGKMQRMKIMLIDVKKAPLVRHRRRRQEGVHRAPA